MKRVLLARGITEAGQLELSLKRLQRPDGLGGIHRAAELLARAISSGQRIMIVGDFDADGATGTALAVSCLQAFGATAVAYRVPNRFEFGYGLSPELFDSLRDQQPQLLMTVDNGISSVAGVEAARRSGTAVIVTDHHLPGPELPAADAIVNPNLPGDRFASKHLAGVGVMFYLMAALRQRLVQDNALPASAPPLAEWLDLVALGTVADLVPLDDNNRILVAQGLARLRAGRGSPGILALLELARRDPSRLTASDLAFAVAPRLNAAGRLEDMGLGIECLLSRSASTARELAEVLDRINGERRDLQETMMADAERELDRLDPEDLRRRRIICLHDPAWHQGIVGLVASRVKERTGRPVLAFAPDAPGSDTLKGSARSVRGLHIRDALAAVDAAHPGLIERFGGHAMAAGLSLHADHLEAFREAMERWAERGIDEGLLDPVVRSDGPLPADAFTETMAQALRDMLPWGQGCPEPLFDGHFRLLEHRVVGGSHLKLKLAHPETGQALDGIAFNTLPERLPEGREPVLHLAYHLVLNEFRGRRNAELMVRHIL